MGETIFICTNCGRSFDFTHYGELGVSDENGNVFCGINCYDLFKEKEQDGTAVN